MLQNMNPAQFVHAQTVQSCTSSDPRIHHSCSQDIVSPSQFNTSIRIPAVTLYSLSPAHRNHLSFLQTHFPMYQTADVPANIIKLKIIRNDGSVLFRSAELKQLHLQANYLINSLRNRNEVFWKEEAMFSWVEPKVYYEEILNRTEFSGIERPYIKNNYGHSKSPINNRLEGLFMSAGIVCKSPFGDVCYEYKIKDLLPNISDYHLYFADFYCPKNSTNHKITLVVCRTTGIADQFCKNHLLVKLDWHNNPYFKVDDNNNFHVAKGKGFGTIFIDIFYTEPLHLDRGFRCAVQYTGNGDMMDYRRKRMSFGGGKNNECCTICNISYVGHNQKDASAPAHMLSMLQYQ